MLEQKRVFGKTGEAEGMRKKLACTLAALGLLCASLWAFTQGAPAAKAEPYRLVPKGTFTPQSLPHTPFVSATPNPVWAGVKKPDEALLTLYSHNEGKLLLITVEDYLVGVLAGEMPAGYQPEALKAQAIAARTYLFYKKTNKGCSYYEQADICSDAAHCQAWLTVAERQAKWGSDYAQYTEKLLSAVRATAGLILLYQNKPIEALYHGSSQGSTENAANVYGSSLPYLVAVSSPENASMNIDTTQTFTITQALELLKKAFPACGLTKGNLAAGLRIKELNQSGRVASVQVGSVTCTGVELRRALGLKSANFTLSFSGVLTVVSMGKGHGLGMSQAGAEVFARQGKGYAEILSHYYPGTALGETP